MSSDQTKPLAGFNETAPFSSAGDGAEAPAVPADPGGDESATRLLTAVQEATGDAFERAQQGGVPVLIADADGLWEISAGGARRRVERTPVPSQGAERGA